MIRHGRDVGGLIGLSHNSIVSFSSSSSNVLARERSAGGLIGTALNNTAIDNSYSTGSVLIYSPFFMGGNSLGQAGGLVGLMIDGQVIDSYSKSNVAGNRRVGGLVGRMSRSTIERSYSSGTVSGNDVIQAVQVGGLVGLMSNDSIISESYSSSSVGFWKCGWIDWGSGWFSRTYGFWYQCHQ